MTSFISPQYLSNYTQAKIDGCDQAMFSRFDRPVEQNTANMAASNSYHNRSELQNRREFNTLINNMQDLGSNVDMTRPSPTPAVVNEGFVQPVIDNSYQQRPFQPIARYSPQTEHFTQPVTEADCIKSMQRQRTCLIVVIVIIVFVFSMSIMAICFTTKISRLESKLNARYDFNQ